MAGRKPSETTQLKRAQDENTELKAELEKVQQELAQARTRIATMGKTHKEEMKVMSGKLQTARNLILDQLEESCPAPENRFVPEE